MVSCPIKLKPMIYSGKDESKSLQMEKRYDRIANILSEYINDYMENVIPKNKKYEHFLYSSIEEDLNQKYKDLNITEYEIQGSLYNLDNKLHGITVVNKNYQVK